MSDAEPGESAFGPNPRVVRGEYERLTDLVKADPEAAWGQLVQLSNRTDDAGLFWVADIAEDLVTKDASTFVPRIEAEAQANVRFRRALMSLVPTANDETLNDRLLALRAEVEAEAEISSSRDIGER